MRTTDVVTVIFAAGLSLVNVVFASRISMWWVLLAVNTTFTVALVLTAYLDGTRSSKLLRVVHDWYVIPIIFFGFKEVYFMGYPIHGQDYDYLLIRIDHALLGVNPTQWLAQFAHPFLTEILQVAYFSYYFILVAVGFELYRRRNFEVFQYAVCLFAYGFYLSYVGYFLLPAVGPRFLLHDFHALDSDLPGLYVTNFLRTIINAGESITPGAGSALELAQRDVFPSGHTMLSLIAIFLSFKHRLKVRWWILTFGVLLIVSTVYLRYHYVIDIVAGIVWWAVCIWSAPRIHAWWTSKQAKLRQAESLSEGA